MSGSSPPFSSAASAWYFAAICQSSVARSRLGARRALSAQLRARSTVSAKLRMPSLDNRLAGRTTRGRKIFAVGIMANPVSQKAAEAAGVNVNPRRSSSRHPICGSICSRDEGQLASQQSRFGSPGRFCIPALGVQPLFRTANHNDRAEAVIQCCASRR